MEGFCIPWGEYQWKYFLLSDTSMLMYSTTQSIWSPGVVQIKMNRGEVWALTCTELCYHLLPDSSSTMSQLMVSIPALSAGWHEFKYCFSRSVQFCIDLAVPCINVCASQVKAPNVGLMYILLTLTKNSYIFWYVLISRKVQYNEFYKHSDMFTLCLKFLEDRLVSIIMPYDIVLIWCTVQPRKVPSRCSLQIINFAFCSF